MSRLWRRYPYHDRYWVSSKGDVVRENRDPRVKRFRKLKPVLREGYLFVSIGKNKQKPIHALVLETFDRKRKRSEVCRHLNGNSTDNKLRNLKWGTQKQNEADKLKHGTRVFGEKQYLASLTNRQAIEIYESSASVVSLSKRYAVDRKIIRRIKRDESYALVVKTRARGRTYLGKVSGHEHGRSELTRVQARKIMVAEGSYAEIGQLFGVSKHIVGAVKRKDRYAEATKGLYPPTSTRRNRRAA